MLPRAAIAPAPRAAELPAPRAAELPTPRAATAPAPRATGLPSPRGRQAPYFAPGPRPHRHRSPCSTGRLWLRLLPCSGVGLRRPHVPWWVPTVEWVGEEEGSDKWPSSKIYQKTLIVSSVYFYLDFMHVVPHQRVYLSDIMLVWFNSTISAHWNEFAQNRWIFAISRNTDGFAYLPTEMWWFLDFSQGFTLTAAGPPPSAPPSPSPFENWRIPVFFAPAARGGENLKHELGVVIRSLNLEFAQSTTLL
jgi:hypothetical protein